jgi:hypothetical protein
LLVGIFCGSCGASTPSVDEFALQAALKEESSVEVSSAGLELEKGAGGRRCGVHVDVCDLVLCDRHLVLFELQGVSGLRWV